MKLSIPFFYGLLLLFTANMAFSQNLDSYRWKNRLVLLVVNDEQAPQLDEQLKRFQEDPARLKERKLEIITIKPKAYRLGNNAWRSDTTLYKQYHRKDSFEFVLIGLDGGEKLRKPQPIQLAELYRIIDSMPVRAAEIRRNN